MVYPPMNGSNVKPVPEGEDALGSPPAAFATGVHDEVVTTASTGTSVSLIIVTMVSVLFLSASVSLIAETSFVTEAYTATTSVDSVMLRQLPAVAHHPVDERWRDSLLATETYSYARTSTPTAWSELLEKLFGSGRRSGEAEGVGIVWWLLGAIGIGAIVVTLVRNGVLLPVNLRRRRLAAEIVADEDLQRHEVEDRIGLAEAAGDYRAAIRYRYLAILVALEERGRIKREPSRTNRDYVRDLEGVPYRTAFQDVVRTFDVVWYGEVTISREDYDTIRLPFLDLVEMIRRSAP